MLRFIKWLFEIKPKEGRYYVGESGRVNVRFVDGQGVVMFVDSEYCLHYLKIREFWVCFK